MRGRTVNWRGYEKDLRTYSVGIQYFQWLPAARKTILYKFPLPLLARADTITTIDVLHAKAPTHESHSRRRKRYIPGWYLSVCFYQITGNIEASCRRKNAEQKRNIKDNMFCIFKKKDIRIAIIKCEGCG